ncbi:MAG: hypothetical protein O9313_18055 [Acetobacteraceae bacterium]|nr:hypothetical protein [Acetobacteraceae bacterium]
MVRSLLSIPDSSVNRTTRPRVTRKPGGPRLPGLTASGPSPGIWMALA